MGAPGQLPPGQWPSLEYQAQARDRDWLDIALKQMVPDLAKRFPRQPGLGRMAQGPAQGRRAGGAVGVQRPYARQGRCARGDEVSAGEGDTFKVEVKGAYADGTPFNGSGSAILYNGYEWRGNVKVGEANLRQVFAAIDGQMKGRMFEAEHDERGLDFNAAKAGQGRCWQCSRPSSRPAATARSPWWAATRPASRTWARVK
jgi:quinohemoprotein amine dehydrogenase